MSVTLTVQQASTLARLAAESPDGAVTLHQLGGDSGAARPHDVYAAPAGAREPQVCICAGDGRSRRRTLHGASRNGGYRSVTRISA